jgi:hypothetical protein
MKQTVGRVWLAASKEPSRPILTHVAFDAEKGTLTATNSYIAARVPCEVEDGDVSGLIPAVALKESFGKSLRVADGFATLTLPDGERRWSVLADTQFPDVDKILGGAVEGLKFGLNPDLVQQLGLALCAGTSAHVPISLHPVNPLHAMRVTASRDAVGVIMPVRLPDVDRAAQVAFGMLDDDAAVIDAARAALAQIEQKRGKAKAAKVFRETLTAAA